MGLVVEFGFRISVEGINGSSTSGLHDNKIKGSFKGKSIVWLSSWILFDPEFVRMYRVS